MSAVIRVAKNIEAELANSFNFLTLYGLPVCQPVIRLLTGDNCPLSTLIASYSNANMLAGEGREMLPS